MPKTAAMAEEIPDNANEHCPGPSSTGAGTASSCEGCPNQQICKVIQQACTKRRVESWTCSVVGAKR